MEKTISSRVIFEGRAVKLRVDTVDVNGRESTREIVEHADCVAIIPLDDKDNILLVRQYRKAVEKELLEIPAGGIDPGEDAEMAVKREMQEETGYIPGKMKRIGGFYSSPGFCTEYLHLFLVSDLTPSRLVAEDTEGIQVVPTPAGKIAGLLDSGEICDSKSIAGLRTFLNCRD
ncbi:MAG: NUDIX hydrolase [Dehalococcoidales bacterium]|nr:NUDIX hydrolase [Dehalococcoidales bacterium]